MSRLIKRLRAFLKEARVRMNRLSNGFATNTPPRHPEGSAVRKKQGIASGTRAEICYAIHAEQNAIIQAARLGVSIDGATLYCTHQPCVICAKMIVNAGIRRVVYRHGYPDDFAVEMLREGGVLLERFEDDGDNANENANNNEENRKENTEE